MNPAQLDKSSVVAPESADGGALGRRSGRGSSVVVADGVVGRHNGRGATVGAVDGGHRSSKRMGSSIVGGDGGRWSSDRTGSIGRPDPTAGAEVRDRSGSDGQVRQALGQSDTFGSAVVPVLVRSGGGRV